MTDLPDYLRRLATAIERRQKMDAFIAAHGENGPSDPQLTALEWTRGNGAAGVDIVRPVIMRLIDEQWPKLCAGARQTLWSEECRLRSEVQHLLSDPQP